MSLKRSILVLALAVIAVTAIAAGCTTPDDEVLYCNPDDESWILNRHPGAMHIDLEGLSIYGDDTSSNFVPFVTGPFAGFQSEFPLMLFDDAVDPSEIPRDLVVDDVRFRVSAVERSDEDLWLITARPADEESARASSQRSTVIYSPREGVLLIGLESVIGEKTYVINYVPCTRRALRYDDLRSLAEADRRIPQEPRSD